MVVCIPEFDAYLSRSHILQKSVSPSLGECFVGGHKDAITIKECLYPVDAAYFFFHGGMSYLDEAAHALNLFFWDIGAGEGSESEHFCKSSGVECVIFGDKLSELNGVGYLNSVVVLEKGLIDGVVAGACFKSYDCLGKIGFEFGEKFVVEGSSFTLQ